MPRSFRQKSIVWNFFDKIMNHNKVSQVNCQLCDRTYTFFGNTTNLMQHLKRKHPIQLCMADKLGGVSERRSVRNSTLDSDYAETSLDQEDSKAVILDDQESSHALGNDDDPEYVPEERITIGEEWLEQTDPFEEKYSIKRKRKSNPKYNLEILAPSARKRQNNSKIPDYDLMTAHSMLERDESAVFGEYVGNKLRKLTSAKIRTNVQQIINTVLWQADYGAFEEVDSVKKFILNASCKSDSASVDKLENTTAEAIIEVNI